MTKYRNLRTKSTFLKLKLQNKSFPLPKIERVLVVFFPFSKKSFLPSLLSALCLQLFLGPKLLWMWVWLLKKLKKSSWLGLRAKVNWLQMWNSRISRKRCSEMDRPIMLFQEILTHKVQVSRILLVAWVLGRLLGIRHRFKKAKRKEKWKMTGESISSAKSSQTRTKIEQA